MVILLYLYGLVYGGCVTNEVNILKTNGLSKSSAMLFIWQFIIQQYYLMVMKTVMLLAAAAAVWA